MPSVCKKWLLIIAGIIILGHNLTPHYHHHDTPIAGTEEHHDHDDDDDDESDGFATHHLIDHTFVTQHFLDIQLASPLIWALAPVCSFEMTTPVISYFRTTPLPADESPPVFSTIRQLSYRGPPSC